MNWYQLYIEKVLYYDIIQRDPFYLKENYNKNYLKNIEGFGSLTITFGKSKDVNSMILKLSSFLKDLSNGSKIRIFRDKNITGRKVYIMSVRMQNFDTFMFLDFFFNMIVKGLKRRYVNLRYSKSNTGNLMLSFANISELDLDDFFFFDLYEWAGHLNFSLKMYEDKRLNLIFNELFLNVFNIKNLSKYEIFNRKG